MMGVVAHHGKKISVEPNVQVDDFFELPPTSLVAIADGDLVRVRQTCLLAVRKPVKQRPDDLARRKGWDALAKQL